MADVQVPCTRYGDRRPLTRARFRWRPAAMGGACGATPRLAAAGCAKACRPRRWRFALVRHEGRFTDTPPGFAMEHPRHASSPSPQSAARGVLACCWGVGLARVRAQAGEAVTRGCRVGHVSIRERAARASLACRESLARERLRLGLHGRNLPAKTISPPLRGFLAQQILFASRFSTLLRPLRGAASPSPAGRITTRTHWRDLVQPERRNHHG